MCIISIAGEDTDKYSKEFKDAVYNGMDSNRDGSGYAYWKRGMTYVHWKKGFMLNGKGAYKQIVDNAFDIFWKELVALKLQKNDLLIVHHRIGTSGTKDRENCHPFLLEPNEGVELGKICITEGKTKNGVLFHNGMFSGTPATHQTDYNDTAYLTAKLFSSCPENIMLLRRDPNRFKMFYNDFIETNKIAVLFPNKIVTIGGFYEDKKFTHSNLGYQSRSYNNYGGRATAGYPEHSRGYSDDVAYEDAYWDHFDSRYNPRLSVINPNNSLNDDFKEDQYIDGEGSPFIDSVDPKDDLFDDYDDLTPIFDEKSKQIALALPSSIPASRNKHMDYLKRFNNLGVNESVREDIDKVIARLNTNWADNQKHLKQLLILDSNSHAGCFNFIANTDISTVIKKGHVVTCYDFDFQEPRVKIIKKIGNKQTIFITSPTDFLDSFDVLPGSGFLDFYMDYLKLRIHHERYGMSNRAFKHLRTMKNKKGTSVHLDKPFKAEITTESIRAFLEIWDSHGIADQALMNSVRIKQQEELVN